MLFYLPCLQKGENDHNLVSFSFLSSYLTFDYVQNILTVFINFCLHQCINLCCVIMYVCRRFGDDRLYAVLPNSS